MYSELDTRGHILHDFIHMKYLKKANIQRADEWLPGAKKENRD